MGYEVTLIKDGADTIEIRVQHGKQTLVLREMISFANMIRDMWLEHVRELMEYRPVTVDELQKELEEINLLGQPYWKDYLADVDHLGWDEPAVRQAIQLAIRRDKQR